MITLRLRRLGFLPLSILLVSCGASSDHSGEFVSVKESTDQDGIRLIEIDPQPAQMRSQSPVLQLLQVATIGGEDESQQSIVPSSDYQRTSIASGPSGQIGIADIL